MAVAKKKVSKKTASNNDAESGKPVTVKKKTTVRKKATAKKEPPVEAPAAYNASAEQETESKVNERISNRQRAAASRQALLEQLRMDLHAGKNAFKGLATAGKQHLNLVMDATECEFAVIKEQISDALKRNDSLLSVTQKKAREILTTSEDWSKQQLGKARDTADKIRNKIKK